MIRPAQLNAADAARVLGAVGRIAESRTIQDFADRCAVELHLLVPGLSTSYNEFNPRMPKAIAAIHPEPGPEWWTTFTPPFESAMHEHPLVRRYRAEGDRGPMTWEDADPARAFPRTRLFLDFYAPNGIHSQLGFFLDPPNSDILVGIAVNRDGAPFTSTERAITTVLAEHLRNLHRLVTYSDKARLSMSLLGLSPRQSEVAQLVAEGLTNAQIAKTLGISMSTVRRHLEAIFAVLGVQSRAAAVARLLQPAL